VAGQFSIMFTTRHTPTTRRRLGLAAGALLAVGALALPAGASASYNVEAPRTLEGNSGLTEAHTKVHVKCDQDACAYEVRFTAGTAKGFEDYGWDPPKELHLQAGEEATIDMLVEIVGDPYFERDETYGIVVSENGQENTYVGGTIVNDDPVKVKHLGKAKPPVNAPETMVDRYDWSDDTSVGNNCVTKDAQGWKGGFGAWGYYIPGCVTKVYCPEGRFCIAKSNSTITSTGAGRVTLNERTRVEPGNGTPPWHHDASCDNRQECTASDESILIHGGGWAELQCNGVQALKDETATVECNLDLEYQYDV
jgi:hypothetical protein